MTTARPTPDDAELRECLIPLLAEAMCVQQGGVWRFVGEQRQGEYLRHARAVVALGWVPPDRLAALAQQVEQVRALVDAWAGDWLGHDAAAPFVRAIRAALDATHNQEGS